MDDPLTTFLTFFNETDAGLVKSILEANEIKCWIYNQHASHLTDFGAFRAVRIELKILESEAKKAKTIMSEHPFFNPSPEPLGNEIETDAGYLESLENNKINSDGEVQPFEVRRWVIGFLIFVLGSMMLYYFFRR